MLHIGAYQTVVPFKGERIVVIINSPNAKINRELAEDIQKTYDSIEKQKSQEECGKITDILESTYHHMEEIKDPNTRLVLKSFCIALGRLWREHITKGKI